MLLFKTYVGGKRLIGGYALPGFFEPWAINPGAIADGAPDLARSTANPVRGTGGGGPQPSLSATFMSRTW